MNDRTGESPTNIGLALIGVAAFSLVLGVGIGFEMRSASVSELKEQVKSDRYLLDRINVTVNDLDRRVNDLTSEYMSVVSWTQQFRDGKTNWREIVPALEHSVILAQQQLSGKTNSVRSTLEDVKRNLSSGRD